MDLRLFIIEIIMLIVTCISVVIAGISTYLFYKNRTAPFREALYSKQLDIYIELVDTLLDFHLSITKIIEAKSNKEGERVELLQLQEEAANKTIDLTHKFRKGMAVIPLTISEPILKLIDEAGDKLNIPFKIDKGKELRDSIRKVVKNIYDIIGTKPLSIETLKLIEKIKS